jgi:cytidine deaminase
MSDIDWSQLREEALAVAQRAYAPYSHLRGGAAARTESGRIVAGCNVENASYPVGTCAETGLVAGLHSSGYEPLVAVATWSPDIPGAPLMPCGACRQTLFEAGGADLQVAVHDGQLRLADLLPDAFGPDDLPASS